VNPISHPLFIGRIGAKEGADFRAGSLPLGLRFVRSSLEAFNLALLGPTALIDLVHKPSIKGRCPSFTVCSPILVRLRVHGDNDKGRKKEERRTLWVVPFVALVVHWPSGSDGTNPFGPSHLNRSDVGAVTCHLLQRSRVGLMPFSPKVRSQYSATTLPKRKHFLSTSGSSASPQRIYGSD